MPAPRSDQWQLKSAMAVLVACIAQTLDELDRNASERLLANLETAYRKLRDDPDQGGQHVLEVLSWTRELLTGWNIVHGQGKRFFDPD